jgi:integrase
VPLAAVLLEHMRQWKEEDDAHDRRYVIHYHGARVESISRGWMFAKQRAGISRRLRLYDLRHAAATKMIARGADIKTVAKILGHKSPVTTMTIYQHVSDDQTRAAIDKL